MPLVKIPTSFNLDLEFEVAEFHRRFFAWILDVVIQVVYVIATSKIMSMLYQQGFASRNSVFMEVVEIVLWMPIVFYYLVFEIFTNGQSLGKKMMGIRVVNENGGKASLSQFLIRWLIRVSDLMMILIIIILTVFPYAAGYSEFRWALLLMILLMLTDIILVATSNKAQRIGDVLAETILVRTTQRGNIDDTVFRHVEDNYVPQFPQIMRLSDKDINAIKSILDTAHKKGDYNLALTASEKIKAHLGIDSPMSPYDFLATALKDYNYLSVK